MTTIPTQPTPPYSFTVHSTFRDGRNQRLKPDGLEWHLPGLSAVWYVPYHPLRGESSSSSSSSSSLTSSGDIDLRSPQVRRGIVEAHNRWAFAKDLPFVKVDDLISLSTLTTLPDSGTDGHGHEQECLHIAAKWRQSRRPEQIARHANVAELIQNDGALAEQHSDMEDHKSSRKDASLAAAAEVWINGRYCSDLCGPSTLPPILDAINGMHSKKVCYRRSAGLIRIERYFSGMIRGVEVFDHLMDNLYGMEDAAILDDRTIIGTVSLPDWILGGVLTSRLWVRELPNGNILTLRPLRDDDLDTSDRRYELRSGGSADDRRRIELVRTELRRLRYLAQLEHPADREVNGRDGKDGVDDDVPVESSLMRQHRVNRRRQKMRL